MINYAGNGREHRIGNKRIDALIHDSYGNPTQLLEVHGVSYLIYTHSLMRRLRGGASPLGPGNLRGCPGGWPRAAAALGGGRLQKIIFIVFLACTHGKL